MESSELSCAAGRAVTVVWSSHVTQRHPLEAEVSRRDAAEDPLYQGPHSSITNDHSANCFNCCTIHVWRNTKEHFQFRYITRMVFLDFFIPKVIRPFTPSVTLTSRNIVAPIKTESSATLLRETQFPKPPFTFAVTGRGKTEKDLNKPVGDNTLCTFNFKTGLNYALKIRLVPRSKHTLRSIRNK
jgi:hypothetical protein